MRTEKLIEQARDVCRTDRAPANAAATARQELISEIRTAAVDTHGVERRFLDWLAASLDKNEDFALERTLTGFRLVEIVEALGLDAKEEQNERFRQAVRFWGDRVPVRPYPTRGKPRTSLPGVEGIGTAIPLAALVNGLKREIATAKPDGELEMLQHLLAVAQQDRTLPANAGKPFLLGTLRQIGTPPEKETPHRVARAFNRWAYFFHLRPTIERAEAEEAAGSSNPRVALERHIKELRKNGQKLAASEADPTHASLGAIEAATRIRHQKFQTPACLQMIQEEIASRGLGPIWRYQDHRFDPMTEERRRTLLAWCTEEVAAGRQLPIDPKRPDQHDYEQIVRMSGRPGPSLHWHGGYRADLQKLQPVKTERVAVDDETTFEQFAELFADRRCSHLDGSSRNVTRSKAKGAVLLMARHLNETGPLSIATAFRDEFDRIISEMEKAGTLGSHPANTKSELRAARDLLVEELGPDGLGNSFSTVLRNALRRSPKSVRSIEPAIGTTRTTITAWISGRFQPTQDSRETIAKLETELELTEGRLTQYIRDERDGRPKGRKVPKGVFPHLPDDWRTLKDEEFDQAVLYIQSNLLERNNAYGAVAREVARRRIERTKAAIYDGKKEVEIPRQFQKELDALVQHMMPEIAGKLHRRGGQRWTSDYTAQFRIDGLLRFVRWQITPVEEGGLGRDPKSVSLADVLHPPLVFAYLDHRASSLEHVEWQGQKRGKIFTASELDVLYCIKALVSKDFGFVTQHPDWAERIAADQRALPTAAHIDAEGSRVPDEEEDEAADDRDDDERPGRARPRRSAPMAKAIVQAAKAKANGASRSLADASSPIMPATLVGLNPRQFRARCQDADLKYRSTAADLEMIARSTRDPMGPIMTIVESVEPMVTLLRQIALASRQPRLVRTTEQHHLQVRNLLMNRLLAITSLRSKNIRQLTFGIPGAQLFKDAQGRWTLRIDHQRFKNFRSSPLFGRKGQRQPYEKILPNADNLHALIEEYVGETLPWFQSKTRVSGTAANGELFLTSAGAPLHPTSMWQTIFEWTAYHVAHNPYRGTGVPGCQPFGPHAYRDIRASDILLNPKTNNPYLEAALALQTSPAMIMNHYGHVKTVRRTAFDDIRYLEAQDRALEQLELVAV